MAHLVVVDDDALATRYMQRVLTIAGWQVSVTATARDTQRLLAQHPADLVLLDVALPDASGLEMARWLRGRHADVGILFVSGHAGIAERMDAFAAGADDYLCKPIRATDLVARVRALLGRRMVAPPSPTLLAAAGLTLDLATRRVTLSSGQVVPLEAQAARVLAALLSHPGQLIALGELAHLAEIGSVRDAEAWALRLRDAIEPDPLWARHVQFIRNVGARLLSPRR